MPEAKLAREAEIPYALIALVTDYDSWRVPPKAKEGELPKANDPHALLNEIIFNLKMASDNAIALIKLVVERIAQNPSLLDSCPATNALERAIWSDKSQIDQEEINRLSPLWGRYFS